jgi:hypothetical protein
LTTKSIDDTVSDGGATVSDGGATTMRAMPSVTTTASMLRFFSEVSIDHDDDDDDDYNEHDDGDDDGSRSHIALARFGYAFRRSALVFVIGSAFQSDLVFVFCRR